MRKQIICSNCNAALDPDARFCTQCGTEVQTQTENADDIVFCTACGAQTTTEFTLCPECGKPLRKDGQETSQAEKENVPEKKKIKLPPFKWLYIGIAAAVILIVFAVLIGKSGSKQGNHLIYVKDKELQYTKLSKPDPFEMTSKLKEGSLELDVNDYISLSYFILMSDDGRFIYYPDRMNSTYSYYWRDLKADNKKTDTAVKVDSDISQIPFLTEDGNRLFYIKGDDDRIYLYDRKADEKVKLDGDVNSFYVNETGDYLIYDKYQDGEYSIYEMHIKNMTGEKNKLDSNSTIYTANAEDKNLYYLKDDTLYFKEYKKEKVKIASNVAQVISVVNDTSIYYLKTEEVKNKLSDFIYDDMADGDRSITAIPPAPLFPNESDYTHQVWYAWSWGSDYNPETGEYGYWSEETDWDEYNRAYEKYMEDFAEWEKIESSYYRKQIRDELREALNNEDNAVKYNKYSLYYWNKGTETLVASDLASGNYSRYYLAAFYETPVVVYQKYNTSDSGKQKMSELFSYWDNNYYIEDIIWDLKREVLASRDVSDDIYVAAGEKESILDCHDAIRWSIDKSGTIYFLDEYNFEKDYGTLMAASVSNGVLAKPVKIDEDVTEYYFGNQTGRVYYFKDVKNNSGDLYLAGKSISSDVYIPSLFNFEDTDILLYYIDYNESNMNGTLCMFKDGKQTKIADDVSFFTPVNEKNVAYLTDYSLERKKGDLMLYNGKKEPTLIDTDVTALLWNRSMLWGDYIFYTDLLDQYF